MKVIAMGFVMHPGAYLRSAWNMVDFLIMLTSTMSMATNSPEFKIFRSFRLLRALRPLRMIRRLRGMQVVVVALIRSMPTTVNVLTFGCFLFFIFGVLGVQMFGLTFYRCNDPDVSGKDACVGMFVPPNVTEALANMGNPLTTTNPLTIGSSIDVLSTNVTTATTTVLMSATELTTTLAASDNVTTTNTSTTTTTTVALAATTAAPQMISRMWKNRAYNFDNLWNAMISLFVVATMDNWLDIAFDAVDATGIDSQPSTGTQPVMFLFFVAWIIMGSLFFFNLLVGVVVDQYLRIQAETGELVLRTEEQKHWAEAIKTKKYQSEQSETTVDVPDNFIQKAMFQVLFSTRFDVFIMLCIVFNVLLMASYHHNQAAIFTEAQTSLGFIFSMVFLFEAILKLLACGPSRYWRDPWNRFDAIIVLFGLPSMLGLNIGLGPSVFRIFRVGRLFKLLKGARGLRALFNTFLDALPALGNVGSLLFLLMFTYAVLGMNLYADLPRDDVITTNNNFSDFSASLLVLFRVFTKDAWSEVMEACYKCHELESDCGIQVTAPFYFISFIIMASYIMLYLVIATMLFYFSENATNESLLSATSFFDALQRKMMLDKFMGKLTKKLGKHKAKMSKLGKRGDRR
ncbi:voltage-dependent calcium channel T type alpha-1G [Pycnococcus provasolii]